ncbi:MAG: acyltransferase family protein, partial [Brachybacterium tyrofermentans]
MSAARSPVTAGAPPPPTYRPELHGLRGLAIALVVLYHVFMDRVSGGVDVFLFISAFFLTGSFVRRMETGKPMAPVAYWARTFKRLL